MTENANITEANASTKVILDTRLPVGASPDSTSWQQKGVGEVAQGALNLLVVDLVVTAASTETTFSLDAATAATSIVGVSGAEVVGILGLYNNGGGFEPPTLVHASGATVVFTTAAGTGTDVHRLTILYR
jgi:hypothetical protein|tara:strand:+ start:15649 stop:16038 length:390 start_codon:yes stop_codon:yes gene_type:complete